MITRIEIDGYRLLDNFKADLGDLTVVIGANAVGKSTLIDCLMCIGQCAEVPLNTAIGWHWGMASLLTAGTGEGKFKWSATIQKPSAVLWDRMLEPDQPLTYEVVLRSETSGHVQPEYEVLRRRDRQEGHPEAFKFLEATPYRRMIWSRKAHQLVPFDEALPDTPVVRETAVVETKTPAPSLAPQVPQDVALLLSQIRFFNEFPVPSAVRFLLANMAFYPGFDVTRFSNLRTKPAEIRPSVVLAANGENLGTVMHELLNRYDYRAQANELRDFLRVAYPTFEEIHCDTTFGTPAQVLVRVREKGMPRSMELWELSDGMLRFLCLATALVNPSPPPLIAIDEPEAGLHPRLLPVVADMIKSAAERTQVLITTHSPDLLNRFDLHDVAVMARAEDEPRAVWYRPANRESLIRMLAETQVETLGDLLRSGELEAGA
jgi:predicted ATPase